MAWDKFDSITYEKNMTIARLTAIMWKAQRDITAAGGFCDNRNVVHKLLRSMPQEYQDFIRAEVALADDYLRFDYLIAMLQIKEYKDQKQNPRSS